MDTNQTFFGAATISEVAMINGDGSIAVMASAVDGTFSFKQCNAFGTAASAVQELGSRVVGTGQSVSLGINAANQIITFGIFGVASAAMATRLK